MMDQSNFQMTSHHYAFAIKEVPEVIPKINEIDGEVPAVTEKEDKNKKEENS